MFFSYDLIKNAYDGLKRLDSSEGKSRQEKVSGLRYLLATSHLLRKSGAVTLDLSVGSNFRPEFITAVGDVVALNGHGLYTQDFAGGFDTNKDYGVGSNFFTTRLRFSRSSIIEYPGRPAPLLLLDQEKASILKNVVDTLYAEFGIAAIKVELSIWLLRYQNINIESQKVTGEALQTILVNSLKEIYTDEIASALEPTVNEVNIFLASTGASEHFLTEQPDYSQLAFVPDEDKATSAALGAKLLTNDLDDQDKIYQIVVQLLTRGTKGLLFSGPPGTSKTWYALKVALKHIGGDQERLERVQFHPSFTYEDFIEGLVSTGSASGTDPMFKPKDKVFLNLCTRARADIDNTYILIIDEFSRGDPSKIFGELLTYIEPDYREIEFRLPYSEKVISIPQNVVIFATMNPYDKSVVDLDAAMERRFDVVELQPDIGMLRTFLTSSGIQGPQIASIIAFFNAANKLSPHGFGHTYFKGLKEEIDFILLWNHKLKFMFEKMFRFKQDAFKEVRDSYLNILSEEGKNSLK